MSNALIPFDISCFEDIVGLSRIDCSCFDTNVGWDSSYSGLYVDEAEGMSLKMVDALKDCENDNNLWLLMDAARANGIRRLIGDTNIKLIDIYEQKRPKFQGYIGEQTYKNARILNKTYSGVWFYTANAAGSYMHIKNITTIFNASGTRTITIYNNLNEVITTVPVATINGVYKNPVNITLPLWDSRTKYLQYFFIYTTNSAIQPKDNMVSCNCGGIVYNFNTSNPYFVGGSNKLAGWSKWAMVGNVETDTLDFMDLSGTTSNYMNGLAFDVEMYCDISKQFCFDTPDKTSHEFMSLAFAIQHITTYNLLVDIITSSNVSRYTMMNGEIIQNLMKLHLDGYLANVDFLVKTADLKNTDCLKCRDKLRMMKGRL